jgi:hypothetical protein
MSDFWGTEFHILSFFIFVAYLLVLFHIVVDLFRDHELGGFAKVLWFICLIFLPFLTALVYIIARGGGMGARRRAEAQQAQAEAEAYIRHVAGKSPADQIADARALLDAGTISQQEFEKLKAKALS